MTSSSPSSSWTPVILETARNVRADVRKIIQKGSILEVEELKRLLDSEAENAVERTLRRLGAYANIISEEGENIVGCGGVFVIVDPIDGTTNLARGIPLAVTSLAVSETPYISGAIAALVMNLTTGEAYRAESGRGAWLGRRRIRPSEPRLFEEALISVDISKGAPLEPVEKVILGARHLRQLGCSALALCLVASGVIDAHIDLRGKLRATDAAAGLIILREAGGAYCINGVVGGDLELTQHSRLTLIAASNS